MALVIKDRVRETTTSTGTGTIVLGGAITGFQSFSVIGDTNTTYYAIVDSTTGDWEVGLGTYTASGPSLSRDSVYESSNSNNLVSFSAGVKDVFCTYPADRSVTSDYPNVFTTNQVISTSSSDAALRVTQTGAGNALLVEDSSNPDSTPTVIDANGRLVTGTTSALTYSSSLSVTPNIQVTSTTSTPIGAARFTNNNVGQSFYFLKSRGATVGDFTTVNSGDTLGSIFWLGSDGSDGIRAAQILAGVDGTPGTNDMPGRLVFSTTADGASSPTERMRIGSSGGVGIGSTALGDTALRIGKSITGATSAYGVFAEQSVQSDVTTNAALFQANASTAAASFTLGNLYYYSTYQATIGAGSAVTNQYGFFANSALTGATNNYGFYSNIASGTGRWNFYAAGTADNYFAGNVGVGTTLMSGKVNINTGGASDITAALGGTFPAFTYRNGSGAWFHAGKHPSNDYFYIGNGATPTTAISMVVSNTGVISLGAVPGSESLRVTPVASAVNYINVRGGIASGTPYFLSEGSDTNISQFFGTKGTGFFKFFTDSNGNNVQLLVAHAASAVNYIQIAGAATAGAPYIRAAGSDTNISLTLASKGTGSLFFLTNNGSNYGAAVAPTGTSDVNYTVLRAKPTGIGPAVEVQGSDTNIDLLLAPKGTGQVKELVGSTYYALASQYDVGSAPNQIPLNQYLGTMAFQDSNAISVGTAYLGISGGNRQVEVSGTTASGIYTLLSRDTTNNMQLIGGIGGVNLGFYSTGGGTIRFYTNTGITEPQFTIARTSSSVNYVQVTGSTTGNAVAISSQGSDTNVPLAINVKGGTSFDVTTNASARQFSVAPVASAVNYVVVYGAATGGGVNVGAAGSDTNINLKLLPKGTGRVQYGTHTSTSDTAISGYIEILDAAGNVRKLAVIT